MQMAKVPEQPPPRPRVQALLEAAFACPVVAVFAGQGYGKQRLVADFLARRGAAVVWLRLTKLHNLPKLFWQSLLAAFKASGLQAALPEEQVDFPETPARAEAFAWALAGHAGTQPLVLVIEGHEFVRDTDIKGFLQALAACPADGFRLWLLGRVLPSLDLIALLDSGRLCQISGKDLCFTSAEVARLLEHHGIPYSQSTLQDFYRRSEGWPLMVEQMVQHFKRHPADDGLHRLGFPTLEPVFEQWYFAGYSADNQRLLVKLSCLPYFNAEILARLGGMQVAKALELLQAHPFVEHDPLELMYTFHTMYRDFLAAKQSALPAEELVQVYALAGCWFLETGRFYDAIPCLEKAGRYDEMYGAILSLPLVRPNKALADFVLDHLNQLPEAYAQRNPLVRCTRASMLISNLEIEEAEAILLQLRQEYEQPPQTPEGIAFLGELYLMLSDVSFLRNRDDFAWYYARAAECLPNRSRFRDERLMLVENTATFYLPGNQPGERERMEALYSQALPVGTTVMRGCGWGIEHLFVAESAYLAHELSRAETAAYRAIYKAQEKRQHDIVCNAHSLLVRICMVRGNYKDACSQLERVTTYVQDNNLTELFGLRDCIQSWLYICLEDDARLPGWLADDGAALLQMAPTSYARPWLLRAAYLMRKQEHHELLALLLQMEEHYTRRGMWAALLYTRVMQALCYLKIDDAERAMDALWAAYDMSHANGVIMPFVEQGSAMRALADAARKQAHRAFEGDWLDAVQQKASTYGKRRNSMVAQHHRGSTTHQPGAGLTRRELEVLQNMAQGLTRDEIGLQMHISVNTVKSMIKNIYNKLNAANRADAIHIASMIGLIA